MASSAHFFDFGVYDVNHEFDAVNVFAIEHAFISWASYSSGAFTTALNAINSRGRYPLMTLEMWPDGALGSTFASLMDDVLAGKYDAVLGQIATDINAATLQYAGLYLRPMAEMENVTGVYPWAITDSAKSIAVWQHVVNLLRSKVATSVNDYYVWSPVGDDPNKVPKYWPGTAYVDACGCSLYTNPTWELDFYGRVRPFTEQMDIKNGNLAVFNKQMLVAESGVTTDNCTGAGYLFGAKGFQRKHLFDFFNAIKANRYPLLKHYVYFQAVDSYDWIVNNVDYGKMSWKCSPHIFESWFGQT